MTAEKNLNPTAPPANPPRIGFALSTKERTELTRQILPGLDCGGFDLIWCDGSKTPDGRAFARADHFSKTPLKEIHHDVTGGPDAAIQFSLKRLLALGYDYVGLIENDIQLKPGWLEAMFSAWRAAERDGFKVGAVTARTAASRVLTRTANYTVQWNLGAGMALFSRAGAEAVLKDYQLTGAKKMHEFYQSHLGVDLSAVWELFMDQPDRGLGADWHYAPSLMKSGLVALGVMPNYAENIDVDFEAVCGTRFVRSLADPLPAHCLASAELLARLGSGTGVPPVCFSSHGRDARATTATPAARPRVAEDLCQGKNLTAVQNNSEFEFFLRAIIRQKKPRFIVETGTYLGQGTTRIIASALRDHGLTDATFYSVECNPEHHRQALANLGQSGLLPFVTPLHGISVPRALLPDAEAIRKETIENVSGDIFVDHHEAKRIELYLNETNYPDLPDDLLGQCLRECDGQPDLLLLDSAGHMGNVEFNYVLKLLRGPCYLALDDIRHVKHAASVEQMKSDPRFEMLAITEEKFGSCLAKFNPVPKTNCVSLDGANRILFARTDSIGDAVLASAMLAPLRRRYPDAKLAVLCQQHVAELFTACPLVDSVICYDQKKMDDAAERGQILAEIAAFKPDVILNSVRSRDRLSNELALAFRAAHHLAIAGDRDNISAADHAYAAAGYEFQIPTPDAHQPELARHADFLRGLGIETLALKPVVWTSPDDELLAEEFFKQQNLEPQRTLALFPFTQHGLKDYPQFAAALKDFAGWNILIFGGAETQARCELLAAQLPGTVFNLAGRTSLRELAALIRRCKILVGSDTSGPHIACAVGVPNVVVLGGGHFGRFLPYSPLTSVVTLPLDCFGCNWRCTHQRAHCITDITPEILTAAIHQTLEKSSPRARLFLPAGGTPGTVPARREIGPAHAGTVPGAPRPLLPDLVALGVDAEIIEVGAPEKTTRQDAAEKLFGSTSDMEIVGEGILEPLVSVVVSTYQSEKFIRACLENLSRQTIFDRCEIIVVDSGSPEDEHSIVAEFQKNFPNIRYLRTPRETLYAAWNRGLALARGRCWANVNTDDSLRDDALEILAASLDKHADCALAYADCAWTTQPNDTFPSAHIIKTVKYPGYAPVETLFYCVTGCLQFFRTESLRQLGGFDATLKCAGDYEATLKVMAAKMNAVHVPEVLSLFFQNTAGLTQASNRAALEHDLVMDRYRAGLDIGNIFQVGRGDPASSANALAALGARATRFSVPWESAPMAHHDFAFACFHAALELDPENLAAGMNLIALHYKLQRLNENEAGLTARWPKLRGWIDLFRAGEVASPPPVKHARLGPVYRPGELANRPTAEQLAREPKALCPWITRIDGRHVYLSEELFPRPAGLRYASDELQAAGKRLAALLAELPPFHAHFGGAGDALLLLASFYDARPDGIIFCHPNGVGAARALFDAFPKLSKIYFLPQHAEPFFHIVLRYAVHQLKNCLGAGTTPKDGYEDEWKAGLDLGKKYRVSQSPDWAAEMRQNENSRRVAVAPQGSQTGMVGSKRNIIRPGLWPQVIAHILERGFEPVILGLPTEAKDYPALPGCTDARGESFPGQMKLIGHCAGLVGADSWAKTFSALAEIPTLVFEPVKGADLAAWKDPSDWVFIEPWPGIKMIRSLEEFRRAFDERIAKVSGAVEEKFYRPVIAWEGSFLDYGSLSHINRELTARLPDVACVGSTVLPGRAKNDSEMKRCAKKILSTAPENVAVTVRHQWPPDWSRPASGSLVVIQPWEFGALPKTWVEQAANVDEFWVPSPLVRHMYLDSGIAPEKVRVVPNGVDTAKFRPGVKPLKLATKKKFKFLFVGGTIFRKGPDVLLEAFSQSFNANDDVCLVIKDFGGDSFYQGQTAEAAIRAIQQKPNAPEILYLMEEFSSEQMPSLYAACDCLVLPYRGEGFGMPVLEAMSCGLPVIVTAGGATESFVPAEAGWKIPSHGIRLGDHVGEIALVKNGWMLEPSKPHLGAILKFSAAHPDECRRRGACGRGVVEKRFDWGDIAATVAHRLQELAERALTMALQSGAPSTVSARSPQTSRHAETVLGAPAKAIALPAVAKIGRLDEARELSAQKNFSAAWNAALAAVAQRPFHPEGLLLLAEIALAAGDAGSTRLCAQRARDFAPGLKAAKQLLNQKSNGDETPDWLQPSSILHPPSSPRLTVCLIAKNEEKFLAQCLQSVRGLASQLVVVDTGSTDRTVEIAREFGAEIHAFKWCDDFAAARNAALEHAIGDWVLMLDADEELPPAQHAQLLADMKNSEAIAFRLPLVNCGQEKEGRSFVPRLFRNAPGIFFHGRIHEQVFPSLLPMCKSWGLKTAFGTAEILHHGYTKELVRDRNKVERNLKLLRQALAENPADANLVMNLGLELVRSDDLQSGIVKYREAFALMSAQPAGDVVPELREALLTQFTSQLYKVRGHEEVTRVLTSPLARNGGLTASLHLALGLSLFELKKFSDAAEQMRLCLEKKHQPALTPVNVDIFTAAPLHCLALCAVRTGDASGAEKFFNEAITADGRVNEARLDFSKFLAEQGRAVEGLNHLHAAITADPKFLPAWKFGGQLALAQNEFLEFALDWTGEAVRQLPDDVMLQSQRAEALLLAGRTAEAVGRWLAVWEKDRLPRSLAALILCSAVESQPLPVPGASAEEEQASRAFVGWYQRLLGAGAMKTVRAVNDRLPMLSVPLPTAEKILRAALAEAETESIAAAG